VILAVKEGDVPPVEQPKFYITGNAALVGEELAWHPDALPVMEESKVLTLEPGAYMMKITLKGNWDEGVLGYDALTGEIPAGVTRGEDNDNDNICFTLDEAGDVTVTYTGAEFTISGNFHTDVPPVEQPKFYITGTGNLVGEENEWHPDALPVWEESKVLTLEPGAYMLKITLKGNWDEGVLGYDALTGEIPAGVTRGEGNDNDNICFTLDEAGDVTVTYTGAIFTIAGNFHTGDVPPVEAQYGLLVNNQFVPATKNEGYTGEGEEWVVTTSLNEGDHFQAYDKQNESGWLIALDPNEGNYTNFDVEDNQFYVVKVAGNYTFYIKLIYGNDNMWVVYNGGTGIDEIMNENKAVKVLIDGDVIIIKGGKMYNVLGTLVK
jgi:hypothetical protein